MSTPDALEIFTVPSVLETAVSNTDGTVKISSASGVDIIVANSDNDFLSAAKDVQGNSIYTGFGNGVYDLDGLVASATPAGVALATKPSRS